MFRRLAVWCAVVLAGGSGLLSLPLARGATEHPLFTSPVGSFAGEQAPSAGLAPRAVRSFRHVGPLGPVGEQPFSPYEKVLQPGSQCPSGYLCGQNPDTSGLLWLYSDLGFSLAGGTALLASESFPPPGEPNLTTPIGVITWRGAYVDRENSGCLKPNQFDIAFYRTDPNKPGYPVTTAPLCAYTGIVPISADRVGQVDFGGALPADEYEFAAVLPTPCTLARGHFSIVSSNVQSSCYFLIGPAAAGQGDGQCVGWWQTPFAWTTTGVDVGYCFGEKKPGACCDDRTATCDSNSNEFTCLAGGGRFTPSPATCATMSPPCGQILGACCKDDGTCAATTYIQCVGTGACCIGTACSLQSPAACDALAGIYQGANTTCVPNVCGLVICRGDANDDGQISFSDINPFVMALGNLSAWQAQYPTCPWQNLDINGDGVFSFADINPFVQKLASPGPCPAALLGPDKTQGNQWLGPGAQCTACCSIAVDPNAPHENEPSDCGPDTFNAGCNSSPPTFSTLPLNTWFYGESGTFGAGLRDTDWYVFTLPPGQNHALRVEFQAEFDISVQVLHPGDCDVNLPTGYAVLASGGAALCADPNASALTTRCLPAGTYWLVVMPQAFTGVACRSDYRIRITDTPGCAICSITCPSTGNIHNETEACGANTNGGCDASPSAFEFVGTNWNGTVCGHTYATAGRRDVDYYSFKLAVPSRMMWNVSTEVPIRATTVFQQISGHNLPPACGAANVFWANTLFLPCSVGSSTEGLYEPDPNDPNRPFWFLVTPEDAGGPLFDGYPCGTWGTNENEYSIAWTVTATICPTICTDFGWVAGVDPVEGEPVCSIGYTDVYNSGCDRNDPNKMLTLTDGVAMCAQGGVYLKSSQYTPDYDWYRITIPGSSNRRILIETAGEFAYDVDLYQSATSCASAVLLERYATTPCATKTFTSFNYPPGVYWIRVYAVGTDVTCGKNYVIRASVINASE